MTVKIEIRHLGDEDQFAFLTKLVDDKWFVLKKSGEWVEIDKGVRAIQSDEMLNFELIADVEKQ